MKKYLFPLFISFVLIISFSLPARSQLKTVKKEPRNNWSIGFSYSERGFGPSASYYIPTGKSTDLFFNIGISNVTDSREIERTDIFGNTFVADKVNRVFMMPLSIGIRKELFKGDIEGDFTPLINFGVSPTLILMNPYDKNFFSAIGYTTASYGLGGFAGLGVSFRQSRDMSINFNLSYYYIQVLGKEVQSIRGSTIDNAGGLQLAFGINFMK
ncbi:MAG: hypothetical protein JSS91_12895 [Bacteroidetes bacterium]|nr:hypothetical protein [Bacteroidota bacterium]